MNILKTITHNKLALASLVVLGVLYTMALFAPFFAPYHYDDDDVLTVYAPPSQIHLIDGNNRVSPPFVYRRNVSLNEYYQRVYVEDTMKSCPVKLFVRGSRYKLFGLFESDIHFFGAPGTKVFLCGADSRGRDIFSRILYGAQVSLSIGIVGALLSLGIGMVVGGIAGYAGGSVDNALMRLCEVIMCVPAFYLMLALRAAFPPYLRSLEVYLLIVVILSLIGWASIARIIRGLSLSLREREFVYAARASGLSHVAIITRHILPHTFSYVLAAFFLSIPGYIGAEAALSLLGLG
ncbi:MAG: ABC transporter permease, partial [Candidatus Omnitrophica bacterium]|nr:ABC transporter permease [Candidatus Omnitrophota bacterium]